MGLVINFLHNVHNYGDIAEIEKGKGRDKKSVKPSDMYEFKLHYKLKPVEMEKLKVKEKTPAPASASASAAGTEEGAAAAPASAGQGEPAEGGGVNLLDLYNQVYYSK